MNTYTALFKKIAQGKIGGGRGLKPQATPLGTLLISIANSVLRRKNVPSNICTFLTFDRKLDRFLLSYKFQFFSNFVWKRNTRRRIVIEEEEKLRNFYLSPSK